MQVKVASPWDGLVETLIESGRYASADEAVEDGLRLLQERESKLDWLRAKIGRSLAAGGETSDADVEQALDAATERLSATGS
ncbi:MULTISPECIES: type II toxin-antitoxin system ParD family antitoxin [unclassified Aureimonas]|uniref:type II toxin-antitoxin system ParD family antitoxin n=1 Tax=unclassified Aureimonas TaxID=2615206 RepID=UPI0006F4ACB7|nr:MULTISPECIES: type II toxin-antitoxin system ParD family antitoxin [unclassified Aureimonas]KQT53881.1 hypothetical protein ASG62_11655 [Aureimonas sp. Leaf427]KQT71677.1 hypothetical protein ASG54_19505 [Aureimonas sp. Leaf460]